MAGNALQNGLCFWPTCLAVIVSQSTHCTLTTSRHLAARRYQSLINGASCGLADWIKMCCSLTLHNQYQEICGWALLPWAKQLSLCLNYLTFMLHTDWLSRSMSYVSACPDQTQEILFNQGSATKMLVTFESNRNGPDLQFGTRDEPAGRKGTSLEPGTLRESHMRLFT